MTVKLHDHININKEGGLIRKRRKVSLGVYFYMLRSEALKILDLEDRVVLLALAAAGGRELVHTVAAFYVCQLRCHLIGTHQRHTGRQHT